MRATIAVRRHRAALDTDPVGRQTAALLAKLGLSDIAVESEDSTRAVLSYRWRDQGTQRPEIQYALDTHGIQLV